MGFLPWLTSHVPVGAVAPLRRARGARTAIGVAVALALATSGACDKGGDDATTPPGGGGAGETATATPRFENPGGMWTPAQIADHATTLRELGLAYDPADLTDPLRFPLSAIVSLGGCSASFVSPEGLIATNHHCVTGALQFNSTPDANLLKDGYLAKTKADEKSAGPTARVYVTQAFTDVTPKVLDGLAAMASDEARAAAIEDRARELRESCEAGKAGVSCRIASYYEGAQWVQIEMMEIRDVRLVYAPHAGVGVYGGEIDNWRWPRHTGDWSFYRAYVGKDGQPADFSPDNVPYKPKTHLKVATGDLDEGDLVMVAGYPGRTNRLKTAAEVEEAAQWTYSYRIAMYEQYIAALDQVTAGKPELAIKAASRLRGLNNYLTNFKGMRDGLVKGGVAAQKAELEAGLRKWIDADPERKSKYGAVLDELAAMQAEASKTRVKDAAAGDLLRSSMLLQSAQEIAAVAKARDEAKAAKKPADAMDARVKRAVQQTEQLDRQYDPAIDRAVVALFLQRAAALPEGERPTELLTAFAGPAKAGGWDEAAIAAAVERLYGKTKLGAAAVRTKLLQTATRASLAKSKDPIVALALALEPILEADGKLAKARAGRSAVLRPQYIEALRAYTAGPLAPDANSTLRVTFGTIRGYKPTPAAAMYVPFTTMTELLAKHTGAEPFDAPAALREAAKPENYGPYADPELGDLPVNFLADLDITGGNSGSATLNAKGELIGLVFDGNYEAMASDWVFLPPITRSIHVDGRYMLWVMDAVDGADHLLQEMGVAPAIGG
jgi:hypothetical protein